ncbi:50S ribosomal protein L11 methyltransferase [Helicobacter sp. T3_23-1059]
MNPYYYETCIIPTDYVDIFCDFVLEITKEAIEQKTITLQEWQESSKNTTNKNTKNTKTTKSAKNFKWDFCSTDFSKICATAKNTKSKTINSIIIRSISNPKKLLESLKDFANVLSERVDKKIGFAYKSQKCKNIDWIEAYKKGVSPIKCARFYIRPSWCEPLSKSLESKNLSTNTTNATNAINAVQAKSHKNSENSAEMVEMIIDPSLAFGSGHHASTFLCLESLHRLDLEIGLKDKMCLDLGCGSGILGIAMAKMGAKVEVCDIDKYAIEQAQKNFAQNAVSYEKAHISTLDKLLAQNETMTNRYDIICANILADVLLPLRDDFLCALKRASKPTNSTNATQNQSKSTKHLILSGIIQDKANLIISHFCAKDSNFVLFKETSKDEWVCLNFALLA